MVTVTFLDRMQVFLCRGCFRWSSYSRFKACIVTAASRSYCRLAHFRSAFLCMLHRQDISKVLSVSDLSVVAMFCDHSMYAVVCA